MCMISREWKIPFLCFLALTMAPAQSTDTIQGIVTDSITLAPIESVSVESGGASAITQSDGAFTIAVVPVMVRNPVVEPFRPWITWNPATNRLSGEAFNVQNKIQIIDIAGRTVKQLTYDPNATKDGMTISGLTPGVYTVVVSSTGYSETMSLIALSHATDNYRIASFRVPVTSYSPTATASPHTVTLTKPGYQSKTILVPAGSDASPIKVRLLDTALTIAWNWAGVVGTGQSLAVGQNGTPVASTTQPYGNLKLSTGSLAWPIDPTNSVLKMVPLIEPVGRLASNYPSSWPTNIAGETPHSAMANQITAMVRASGRDYVGVHGEFGENGQGIVYLRKGATQSGVNGRAFEATLVETKAVTRLARDFGKTYGAGAIIVTHGESDAGNANYESDLRKLWSDYNSDLKAVTGQTQNILMIASQQNSTNDSAASTLAQWKIGIDYPDDIVCSGPQYHYPYSDQTHFTAEGYRMLGEKYAQIYYERVICGRKWQPLQPIAVSRKDSVITVRFHVPVMPLRFDSITQSPHPNMTEWKNGKGFEVWTSSGRVTISSVAISGDSVRITCATAIEAGTIVGYAQFADGQMSIPYAGTKRWGMLRDSDPFIGAITKKAQQNYCVAFKMGIP
jgi:hypothetical protein